MPKKGPGGPPEKPLRRPCCGASVEWKKTWRGRYVLEHIGPCQGKRNRKVKYHAPNILGLEVELDS